MQKIKTTLWFDTEAEDAARFYVSIFGDSEILGISRYGEGGPRPAGTVMTVRFRLEGQEFLALNGGPQFKFNEAISQLVNCRDQEEIDRLWERLSEGGEPGPCGWLKDRYGLSWQIIPAVLSELLQDPDPARSQSVMGALLGMGKIDLERLRQAHEGALAAG